MAKLSIRDFWGRATQKKELKPEVRDMLLNLDGVYERKEPVEDERPAEQDDEDTSRTATH